MGAVAESVAPAGGDDIAVEWAAQADVIINDPLHHEAFWRFTRPAALVKRQKSW